MVLAATTQWSQKASFCQWKSPQIPRKHPHLVASNSPKLKILLLEIQKVSRKYQLLLVNTLKRNSHRLMFGTLQLLAPAIDPKSLMISIKDEDQHDEEYLCFFFHTHKEQ